MLGARQSFFCKGDGFLVIHIAQESEKAKDDYQETLEVVTKTLTEDLPMFNGKLPDFYEAVSDAEELGVTRLTSLGKEIKADRWLLTTEREELLRAVAVEEERFLSRLRKRVEAVEGNDKGDK